MGIFYKKSKKHQKRLFLNLRFLTTPFLTFKYYFIVTFDLSILLLVVAFAVLR